MVGYGTQKKANLTGAVATVDVNKTLDSRPIADIGRGLQGSVPGVNITIPTGEIGSDPLIKIRGQIGSISGNNTPLILLDNVEIPSIQMVNPNDVQSISVLKDAASSSIYGSKAAFGVILITTKSGAQTDKFEVSYSNNFSWQDPAKSIEIGGIEALQYTLDAQINRGEPMPAGGFWRISPESLEKAIEWQKQYGGVPPAQRLGRCRCRRHDPPGRPAAVPPMRRRRTSPPLGVQAVRQNRGNRPAQRGLAAQSGRRPRLHR